jgi:hypothetical protein
MQAFWRALQEDGRLKVFLKHKKPRAPLLSFGSYDNECRKHNGGWRYTVCLSDTDIINLKAIKVRDPVIKKIEASKWLCIKAPIWADLNPHTAAPILGYQLNDPISGILSVFPDTTTGSDESVSADRNHLDDCWFPVRDVSSEVCCRRE